jgi:hypothetical protein
MSKAVKAGITEVYFGGRSNRGYIQIVGGRGRSGEQKQQPKVNPMGSPPLGLSVQFFSFCS